jgi:hypothetical protein
MGLGLLAMGALGAQPAWWVAPGGNDAWSGRRPDAAGGDGPFATLERARDAVRAAKAAGETRACTVWLRGGLHTQATTLRLGPEDSGRPDAPVVWRAWRDERPIIIGGRRVTGFVPHQGALLKADMAQQGLASVAFRQLLCNGRRMILARYPNFDPANPYGGGWAYADGKPVPMYAEVPGEDKRTLVYRPQDSRTWARPEDGEVFVFPRYNWWNNIVRIKSIDREQRRITLASDCSYPIRPTDRYFVQGMFEELDAPGEWYLDRRAQMLYFLPPTGVDPATMAVYAPTTRTILELGPGTAHVTWRGLTFECSDGTAIIFRGTESCRLAASVVRNVGDYNGSGVSIDGGHDNGVVGCDLHDIGSSAISLAGGDQTTLSPARNFAENNYLHHFGTHYKQGVGVTLRGCGCRASHNLIHDGPRFGIGFGGNNHVIDYNHIRHVNLETADTGAIYTGGRDWLGSRGTVVRYNWFHDILGYGQENGRWVSPHYCWGIYLDDNTGGVDVIGNVVARCVRGPIHLHNGRDNLVENNIFIEGTLQQIECNGWTQTHRYWTSHLPTMIKGYESVRDQPAWKSMRNMDTHPKDAVLPDGTIMSGNVFRRNIAWYTGAKAKLLGLRNFSLAHNRFEANLYWHGGQPLSIPRKGVAPEDEWRSWQAAGQDKDSLVADPLFVDPARDDYRLKPESPALKLGFQPIPFERIGPYRDELRASWPIVEAEGAREKPLVSEVPH